MTPKHRRPAEGVHTDTRTGEERGPEDLLREAPPDATTGLNPAETEEAVKQERGVQPTERAGVFNHPVPGAGADKCGGQYGRCFGRIVGGVCEKCGQRYDVTTPLGGVNVAPGHVGGISVR